MDLTSSIDSETGYDYVLVPKKYKVYKGQEEDCSTLVSGWVTDSHETAELYSGGRDPCCYVFDKESRLLYLDEENSRKIIESYKLLDDDNKAVWVDYENGNSFIEEFEEAFLSKGLHRESYRFLDLKVLKGLCWWVLKDGGYDGYYSPSRTSIKTEVTKSAAGENVRTEKVIPFHREIALCNPEEFLRVCDSKVSEAAAQESASAEDDTLKGNFVSMKYRQWVNDDQKKLFSSEPGVLGAGWETFAPICKPRLTMEELKLIIPWVDDRIYADYSAEYKSFCGPKSPPKPKQAPYVWGSKTNKAPSFAQFLKK
jgi:hypothetical protein